MQIITMKEMIRNEGITMKKWIGIILAYSVVLQTGCMQSINIEDEMDISKEEGASAAIDTSTEEETTAADNSNLHFIDEEKIINFDEVFHELALDNPPNNFSRNIIIEDYSNDFPQELQEILIQLNDDIEAGDQDWEDYETITTATVDNLPYEDILAATGELDSGSVIVVDIDSDGEDEYVITGKVGTGHYRKTFVMKNIDGNWTWIGGHIYPDPNALHKVLEYEGRYYLIMGDQLTCWNDDAEMPDWENELVPGQTDCWNTLSIEREVTSYTPHELYSNSQDMAMDVLSQVDLTDLSQNAERELYDLRGSWETEHNIFQVRYVWTVYDETEEYEYVISEFSEFYPFQDVNEDLVLTVTRKTADGMQEIVKVYYLAANYKMNFVESPQTNPENE